MNTNTNTNTSLITKYLPKQFADFQMDNRIIQLLTRMITCDCLNLLITSRTGCGKTSLINTIVKTYFAGNPKSNENILVVNSIKEQGIAFYRGDVKTFCQSLSTIPNKKRVVIIDDLDLINEQNQQLFRTCVDQYSKNVNFVASCTDPQKVIESLQSRLISVKIPALTNSSLEKIAKKIISRENLTVSDEALQHMILVSHGSARSLINYLEKGLLLDSNITLDFAVSLCTDISWKEFEDYIDLVKQGGQTNLNAAIKMLYELHNLGFSVMDILDNFFNFIKQTDKLEQEVIYKLIPLLCKHLIRLHETHAHVIDLAFFTNSAMKIINN